jgi:hypothetical protein
MELSLKGKTMAEIKMDNEELKLLITRLNNVAATILKMDQSAESEKFQSWKEYCIDAIRDTIKAISETEHVKLARGKAIDPYTREIPLTKTLAQPSSIDFNVKVMFPISIHRAVGYRNNILCIDEQNPIGISQNDAEPGDLCTFRISGISMAIAGNHIISGEPLSVSADGCVMSSLGITTPLKDTFFGLNHIGFALSNAEKGETFPISVIPHFRLVQAKTIPQKENRVIEMIGAQHED